MSHNLSFSRVYLAYGFGGEPGCSYWARPDVQLPYRESGHAAKVGTAVHSLVEAAVKSQALALGEDVAAEAHAIWSGPLREFVNSHEWTACELGLRYDAVNDTCREGKRRMGASYDQIGPTELPGTIDLVARDGDTLFVVDVKTGKPPQDAAQLYVQGVAAARFYGAKRVRVAYARALKTKLELLNDEVLDEDRLDIEAGRISKTLRSLPMAEPVPSSACDYRCPLGKGNCPAWVSQVA